MNIAAQADPNLILPEVPAEYFQAIAFGSDWPRHCLVSRGIQCAGVQYMKLIAIAATGEPVQTVPGLPELAVQVGLAYKQLYLTVGFAPPWIGYLAQENGVCVGSCGFKGPPVNERVEIAYFAFPEYEGRGFATQMARELLRILSEADTEVIATAQTLPRDSASTAILKKLGFVLIGTINHPEDGEVWEWQR